MEAIQLLTLQHRALEERMKTTLHAPVEQRSACLAQVGDHLSVHLASEEEVFYPAVHARRTEDILLESLEEHLSLKRLLADLMALAPDDATWEAKFKVLEEQSEHHHKEEEEHLFPKVLTLIDLPEREALGRDMLALQERLQREGKPREAMAEQTDKAAPLP